MPSAKDKTSRKQSVSSVAAVVFVAEDNLRKIMGPSKDKGMNKNSVIQHPEAQKPTAEHEEEQLGQDRGRHIAGHHHQGQLNFEQISKLSAEQFNGIQSKGIEVQPKQSRHQKVQKQQGSAESKDKREGTEQIITDSNTQLTKQTALMQGMESSITGTKDQRTSRNTDNRTDSYPKDHSSRDHTGNQTDSYSEDHSSRNPLDTQKDNTASDYSFQSRKTSIIAGQRIHSALKSTDGLRQRSASQFSGGFYSLLSTEEQEDMTIDKDLSFV